MKPQHFWTVVMSDMQSNVAGVKMRSAVDASGSTGSTRSEGASWRRGVALAGIAALTFETVAALVQAPRVEPLRIATPTSLEWWRYPIERNAIQRMPVTGGPLSAVYALRGTDEVWFAGAGGLIVHSRDGGRTWDSTNVSATLQREAPTTPAPYSPATPAPNPPARTAPARKASARARARTGMAPRAWLASMSQRDVQGYESTSKQSSAQQSPQQSYSKEQSSQQSPTQQ
ncbi:MAG TPA: hypothetical protein VM261_08805, partial [Kofleriaceae bacterium]|nr:hypothetical protein [Kofleriaceae bacterium]